MPARLPLRALLVLPLLLGAPALAGCGEERTGAEVRERAGGGQTEQRGGERPQSGGAESAGGAEAGIPEDARPAPARLAERIGAEPGERPSVPTPEGDPPEGLRVTDLEEGDGEVLRAGQLARVRYLGANWSDGKTFDTNFGQGGQPFQFPLGGGQVIPGWDQGLEGMRVGGRRLLVIPPDLGYGEQGSPDPTGEGGIPPNETLIFVVDAE